MEVPLPELSSPLSPLTLRQEGEHLDRALTRVGGSPLRLGNHLSLLRNGPDAFDEWLREIQGARRWIHLENYIFLNDRVGRLFAEALSQAAERGVRVRVLVDWFGSLNVSASFWQRMRERGVEVRLANQPRFHDPLASFKRDHRKFIGVDGDYASVGGVCISETWLKRTPQTRLPYRDTAVGVRGPAVADLERAFARIWDLAGDPLPPEESPLPSTLVEPGREAVRVVSHEPGKMKLVWLLDLLIASARKRIWIADAYFLSSPMLHRALITAARDGVDVRLLLPATSDVLLVGPLSRFGYRSLLEAGVRIWEYQGLMMHAKTLLVDDWCSRIGSTNLNITGLLSNWELDVIVEDADFAARMEEMYEEDLRDAVEVWEGERRDRRRRIRLRTSRVGHEGRARAVSARAAAEVARVGGAALSGEGLTRQERTVLAGAGALALGVGALGLRFPRLFAWPLGALGTLLGASVLARAARYAPEDHQELPPELPPERERAEGGGRADIEASAVWLEEEERAAVERHPWSTRRNYIIGAAVDEARRRVRLWRGSRETVDVPFEWFTPAGDGTTADFQAVQPADFGLTLRLGEYEVDSDSILEEFTRDYVRSPLTGA